MRDNLNKRLKDMLKSQLHPRGKPQSCSATFEPQPLEMGRWDKQAGHAFFCAVRNPSLDCRQGRHRLGEFLQLDRDEQSVLGIDGLNLERILFLDTETTGLAGGTGTLPFLIGIGRFMGEGFNLEQYFIDDFAVEPFVLERISPLLARAEAIVTYNGRAFDWPLLKDRYTLNRLNLPRSHMRNIDLLPLTRTLWRNRLPDCRLSTVENHLLQVKREDDVPGWAIPHIYFNFLKEGNFDPLVPVFLHNRLDILSLVSLAVEVSQTLVHPFEKGNPVYLDPVAVGDYWRRRKDWQRSCRCYRACLEREGFSTKAALKLAAVCKRRGEWQEAVAVWESLVSSKTMEITPYVELAKYHEHKQKSFTKALQLTERAVHLLGKRKRMGGFIPLSTEKDLSRRQKRLQEKLKSRDQPVNEC